MYTEGTFVRRTDAVHIFMRDSDRLIIEAQRVVYEIYRHPLDPTMHVSCLAHHEEIPVTQDMRRAFIERWKPKHATRPICDGTGQHQTAAHA